MAQAKRTSAVFSSVPSLVTNASEASATLRSLARSATPLRVTTFTNTMANIFEEDGQPVPLSHADDFQDTNTRTLSMGGISSLPPQMGVGVRGTLYRIIESHHFALLMGLIIIGNVALMVYETDNNAPCALDANNAKCANMKVDVANHAFLGVYTVEFILRLYVFRFPLICTKWNMLDFAVVMFGFMDIALAFMFSDEVPGPSLSLLRVFRVMRLLRAMKIFRKIPELHAMVRGFLSAMRSMFWGFVMVLIVMLLFSILCVEVVHPISMHIHQDNDYCREAFESIWYCMLLFFQTLIAGDSWGHCIIPVIKDSWWTSTIFAFAIVCVQLGFLSLILAVIVEQASRAAQEDDEAIRKDKQRSERRATNMLFKLFATIDTDASGTISLEELMEGFDTNEEFNNLFARLDMGRSDVELLFELMDSDDNGELSYDYMIENLRAALHGNDQMSLRMLRLQAAEIARCVKRVNCRTSALAHATVPRYTYARAMHTQSPKVPMGGLAHGRDSLHTNSIDPEAFVDIDSPQVLVESEGNKDECASIGSSAVDLPRQISEQSVSFAPSPSDFAPATSYGPRTSMQELQLGRTSQNTLEYAHLCKSKLVAEASAGTTQTTSPTAAEAQAMPSPFALSDEASVLRALLDGELSEIRENMEKLNASMLLACQASSSYQCQSIQKILDLMDPGKCRAASNPPGKTQVMSGNVTQGLQNVASMCRQSSVPPPQPPDSVFQVPFNSEANSPTEPLQAELQASDIDHNLRSSALGRRHAATKSNHAPPALNGGNTSDALNGTGGGATNPTVAGLDLPGGSAPCMGFRSI